jgi:hypothetical protein
MCVPVKGTYGSKGGAADDKGIVLVIVELDFVAWRAVGHLLHLARLQARTHACGLSQDGPGGDQPFRKAAPYLCGNLWLWPELEEAPGERGRRDKVVELEAEGHGRAQGQGQVHRLQVAVREIRSQLGRPRQRCRVLLGRRLACHLERQAQKILAADADHLCDLCVCVSAQAR